VDPYETKTVSIGITASNMAQGHALMPLKVSLTDPGALVATVEGAAKRLYNFADLTGISSSDDVESSKSAWAVSQEPTAPPSLVATRTRCGQPHLARNRRERAGQMGENIRTEEETRDLRKHRRQRPGGSAL
jgi:hypothetical protein